MDNRFLTPLLLVFLCLSLANLKDLLQKPMLPIRSSTEIFCPWLLGVMWATRWREAWRLLGEVGRVPKEPWLSSFGDDVPAEEEKWLGHSQSLASRDLVEQGQAENSKVSNQNCFFTCLCG